MEIAKIKFTPPLYTEVIHLNSGYKMITDAPKDNNGEGKSLSPTDMLSTSLASCMMTIIGIQCKKRRLEIQSMEALVSKTMNDHPRKVLEIGVLLKISIEKLDQSIRLKLEELAKNCPVALSLSKDLKQNIKFEWM